MSKHFVYRSVRFPLSFLVPRKAVFLLCALVLLVTLLVLVSAGIGSTWIHPVEVLKVLTGTGSDDITLIVAQFRLPRVLAALLVGMALAASGAILQGVIRNPLASPDIVGITGGASVAAVAYIILLQSTSLQWLPLAAFAGAAAVTLLMYAAAWKRGVTPLRFVLVGIGIGSVMYALTTMLIVVSPIYLTHKAMVWLTGSVYGAVWEDVLRLFIGCLILLSLAFRLSSSVNIQMLGDDTAANAGNPVQRHRLWLLLICAALTGLAVSTGGAIGFVGLLAPHISRKLVGPSFPMLSLISAVVGGIMVMLADLIGRTLFVPLDVPAGVFTATVGAPFFIYLLYKNRNQ